MQSIAGSSAVPVGARFFDGNHRDLGWAVRVSKRKQGLGRLTILDVTTTELPLAGALVTLDKARLFVTGDASGESFSFAWASGYANGPNIRIQGELEHK